MTDLRDMRVVYVPTGEEVEFAQDWHGGQSTVLSAVASTGSLAFGSRRPWSDDGLATDDEWALDLVNRLLRELLQESNVHDEDNDQEIRDRWIDKLLTLQGELEEEVDRVDRGRIGRRHLRVREPMMTTTRSLSDIMEFDHVIEVTEAGEIIDRPDLYAPGLWDGELDTEKWTLLNGYSGQDRYAGPIMHPSEYIGGGMERDIRETPGVYVALVSYYSPYKRECPQCGGEHLQEPEGYRLWLCLSCRWAFDELPYDENADNVDGWAVAQLKEGESW